jgi:hypothetical protein
VAARAVYLRFYRDAYRVAAAGRTNITYAYRGAHVRAAIAGQWQGIDAGLQVVRERGLQRLRRAPQTPETTPYDREPELRAVYLRSYRKNYLNGLSGHYIITCGPQSGVGEAYCRGEWEGRLKAEIDVFAVERSWLEQYSRLTDCMVREQPQIRCQSSTSPIRDVVGMFRVFLKLF